MISQFKINDVPGGDDGEVRFDFKTNIGGIIVLLFPMFIHWGLMPYFLAYITAMFLFVMTLGMSLCVWAILTIYSQELITTLLNNLQWKAILVLLLVMASCYYMYIIGFHFTAVVTMLALISMHGARMYQRYRIKNGRT